MKTSKLLLAAATLTVAFAQAPGPNHTPSLTNVTQYFTLTDAQVQSLQQIRQQEASALQPLMTQLRTQQQALASAMKSGADATTLAGILQNISSLQKQIQTTRSSFVTQAQAVLTADQATKLKALQDAAALQPTIREAAALDLLTPPQGAGAGFGPGFGPGFAGGNGPGPFAGRGRGGR